MGWSRSNFAVNFGVRKLESRAIMWHYLRDPMFSHFDRIRECDRHARRRTDGRRDRHTMTTTLNIASRGRNCYQSRLRLSHRPCTGGLETWYRSSVTGQWSCWCETISMDWHFVVVAVAALCSRRQPKPSARLPCSGTVRPPTWHAALAHSPDRDVSIFTDIKFKILQFLV